MGKILIFFLLCLVAAPAQALKYENKHHTFSDVLKDQALVFGGHTTGYIITQFNGIREDGSWENYKDNFLQFRFDNDNTAWNFAGHTYTGSQVYLYYRARGYKQNNALYLSFLSSLWFETLIETYTERPSFQDTFNTPLLGSALGYYLEKTSVKLINSDNRTKQVFGRILNPFSYLVDEEDAVAITPSFEGPDNFSITVSFFYD